MNAADLLRRLSLILQVIDSLKVLPRLVEPDIPNERFASVSRVFESQTVPEFVSICNFLIKYLNKITAVDQDVSVVLWDIRRTIEISVKEINAFTDALIPFVEIGVIDYQFYSVMVGVLMQANLLFCQYQHFLRSET